MSALEIISTLPETGDYKVETYYAFFPTKVKGRWIWFKAYQELYEFIETEQFVMISNHALSKEWVGNWHKINDKVL